MMTDERIMLSVKDIVRSDDEICVRRMKVEIELGTGRLRPPVIATTTATFTA